MKILIEKDGIQREIEFPFTICGEREAIELLRNRLDSWLGTVWTYGRGVIYAPPVRGEIETLQWHSDVPIETDKAPRR